MPADSETAPLLGNSGRWWQVWVAGAGFLTDAYDLFVIDLVLHILHALHPMSVWDHSMIVAAASTGAIIGQVSFGLAADYLGRRVTFLTSCVLLIVGALLSACVDPRHPGYLAAARFILGVGIGGEYPLAATVAAETTAGQSEALTRAAMVFSMQGVGMLLSCAVVVIPLALHVDLEVIWRGALGLGAVIPACVVLSRARMSETEDFEQLRQRGRASTTMSEHSEKLWSELLARRWQLLGTGGSWFLLDVCFYAVGSYKARVSKILFDWEADTLREEIVSAAAFATAVAIVAMPGYLMSVAFIARIGWARLQSVGFGVLTLLFLLFGGLENKWALSAVFCALFFFINFGPNTTTFVAPIDVYPTEVRATCHGISAAMGKAGAVLGTSLFAPVEKAYGLRFVAFASAVICTLGIGTTYFATPLKAARLSSDV